MSVRSDAVSWLKATSDPTATAKRLCFTPDVMLSPVVDLSSQWLRGAYQGESSLGVTSILPIPHFVRPARYNRPPHQSDGSGEEHSQPAPGQPLCSPLSSASISTPALVPPPVCHMISWDGKGFPESQELSLPPGLAGRRLVRANWWDLQVNSGSVAGCGGACVKLRTLLNSPGHIDKTCAPSIWIAYERDSLLCFPACSPKASIAVRDRRVGARQAQFVLLLCAFGCALVFRARLV